MSSVLQNLVNQPYKHGFVTDIESDVAPKGLNEDTIRLISAKKNEPAWLLEFRLKAYAQWLTMEEPKWPNVHYPKIDFQSISYYSAPKPNKLLKSMDEVDPELLRTFEKLGVPMNERAKRVTETVKALKAAFTGEPFEHRGRTVQITPRPFRPGGPAVLLGGSSEPRLSTPQ